MKKIFIPLLTCVALMTTSCGANMGAMGGTNGLGGILGGTTGNGTTTSNGNTTSGNGLGNVISGVLGALGSQQTVNSLLDLVIGKVKITQDQLVGQWNYTAPGCAFTSEKLLTQAGGAVAAGQVKQKLQPVYSNIGIKSSNTYFVFDANNKFQAKVDGIPLSGTYQLDTENGAVKLNAALFSITGYVTRTTNGMALTFESKKLLTLLQTASALTGSGALKTIGDLGGQFDGVRIGFDLTK